MRRSVLLVVVALLVASGWATGSTARAGATSTKAVDAALLGRWAHYDVVAYQDGDLKTLIVSYGFNDFTRVRGQIVDTASFCSAEQRTNQPIETSIADAATRAIRPPSTPVTVDRVGGKLRIVRPPTPTPVGIHLAHPATDALPTDPGDPRIADDDHDGKPGITVTIRVSASLSGEIYLARREIFAWEGTLVAPGRITGVVTDTSEQLLVGASDPIFAGSAAHWVQHPDLAKSPILLRRVPSGWGCARLVAERSRLFPPTPVVDW
ncbi:MAG: hypothetical protein WCI50_13015 [Actinomycetes bacterium]